MSLLNLLIQQGSVYTNLDGATPSGYIPNPNTVNNNLADSQLDTNGVSNPIPPIIPLNPNSLQGSSLDLDGIAPPKYLDNLPG